MVQPDRVVHAINDTILIEISIAVSVSSLLPIVSKPDGVVSIIHHTILVGVSGEDVVVRDRQRSSAGVSERSIDRVREHQVDGFAEFGERVIQDWHTERLAGLAGSEGQRAARSDVITASRCRAITGGVVYRDSSLCVNMG